MHKIFLGLFLLTLWGCKKNMNLTDKKYSPIAIFDEVWKVMDQRYALFSVKGVNWSSSYNEYRPQVSNDMTDDALFRLISDMLEVLKDGHVSLISAFNTYTYENFYTAFPANFNYVNIVNNYLKNDYKSSGPVIYKIHDNTGYIYYDSFEKDISDDQWDLVLREMSDTRGLIIDVRNNLGGKLANADRLFKRFISDVKLVKYEITKSGIGENDFFPPEPYYLFPSGNHYNKPICVLINRTCFSACNDFVLYMSSLPNVKLIGDHTGGGGGIPHTYTLSNGWKIQYTSTITLSPQKVPVENGIEPDFTMGITTLDETNGKDPILERAFSLLQ